MTLAKQSSAVSLQSTGAGRARPWPYLLWLTDALIDASAVLVRHRYCAPWNEMAKADRKDK
ncbi:MAG: hypothetical protein EOP17_01025 [Rhizobiaceae bacterium]|nr:MAG: hypothetical protein EOP17_01025 [Rhizobiaceae bacterium]